MDEPILWAVIWLGVALAFATVELTLTGSFFLIPFAVGGGVASVASLFGAPVWLSLPLFIVTSFGSFLALKPYANRLDTSTPEVVGVGANRLVGDTAVVKQAIPAGAGQHGLVRVGGEDWMAQVSTGAAADEGETVRILEVRGNRLIVEPEISALDVWKE